MIQVGDSVSLINRLTKCLHPFTLELSNLTIATLLLDELLSQPMHVIKRLPQLGYCH
jgi:hypothetical protein